MKLILFFVLFYCIYANNSNHTYNKKYSYGFLSTEFLKMFSKNIEVSRGKTNLTKCFAIKDIKINDTIFEYEKKDVISNMNIVLPNIKEITTIIKKYVENTYLQNKFLLSFFIFHVMTNPYNIPEMNNKLRLFILNLPIDQVNPIELFLDKERIEKYLVKKEWLNYENVYEINLINEIVKSYLNIDTNNKTDENYILFGKIYYYVKENSFYLNGNAVILPFLDSCNIVPNFLHKENLNVDSIFIEEEENKIVVKSNLDYSTSNQFIFSFHDDLTNDYLLLTKGKVALNNLNDRYEINKLFIFQNQSQFGRLLLKMKIKPNDLKNLKFKRQENIINTNFSFQLFHNKMDTFTDNCINAYFNKDLVKKYIFIIKMCFDEMNEILKIIKKKFKSKNLEGYLLKVQKEKEISENKNAIMNFNLAKIGILRKNVDLSFKKIVDLFMNDIDTLKINYV